MDRRKFNTLCSGMLAGAASLHAQADKTGTPYPRTQLIYEDDTPVTLSSLQTGVAHIFSYPYRTTPCFLVRLKQSSPAKGSWPGGLGDDRSVVAFSAICSHKMSHPARPISHISYRPQTVTYYDTKGIRQSRDDVISCCSERSVYDPANGASVLAGPAPAPLAAIALEADENENVWASGSFGPDQYERFLEKFGFRLAMEYGVSDVRQRTGEQSIVVRADRFSS
nr:hypothetical protein [Granulosicoccus sp.]